MILKTITCNDPKPTASTNPIATPMFSRSRSKLQGMKRNILIPQTAKMFPCSKQHAMIRHIITPTLFLMKVFVKKSGAATIRRIKTAGNSSQSAITAMTHYWSLMKKRGISKLITKICVLLNIHFLPIEVNVTKKFSRQHFLILLYFKLFFLNV